MTLRNCGTIWAITRGETIGFVPAETFTYRRQINRPYSPPNASETNHPALLPSNALLCPKSTGMYAGAVGFMNWTSTEHAAWADECHEFASKRQPFRLEHVFGQKEKEICDDLCAEHKFRQEKHGSFVLFTPMPS